jgi:HSP20 family protein
MLKIERLQLSHKDAENPWFSQLFVSLGPRGERMCPNEPRVWHPPTDVYEVGAQVTVKIEIAGVDDGDVVVRLDGRQLTVRGCRYDPADKLAYQQMEISYGEFRSDVHLPCPVDESQARAHYADGFLYIHLPKAQQEHQVPVVLVIRTQ